MSALPRARPRRCPLIVGVIGAGRVGAVLGAALGAAGHHVVAASGVSAAARTGSPACCPAPPILPGRRGRPRRDRPAAARRPRRRARRRGRRAGRRPARCGRARSSRTPPARTGWPCSRRPPSPAPAAGAAPGDDLHRHGRRPGPAARHLVRRHRAGRPAGVRRPGWSPTSAAVPEWIAEDARAALPRGPRARRQPPGHAGQRGRGPAARRRRRCTRRRCSRRCCTRRWTTRCGCGDAALTGPVSRGDAGTVAAPPGRAGRDRAGLRAGVSRAGPAHRRPGDRRRAGCARRTPRRCSTCWPAARGRSGRRDRVNRGRRTTRRRARRAARAAPGRPGRRS